MTKLYDAANAGFKRQLELQRTDEKRSQVCLVQIATCSIGILDELVMIRKMLEKQT